MGATPDTDKTMLHFAETLYREQYVRRVYYSAYIPVNQDDDLPALSEPPFLREHRLYQADWLLRFYGFSTGELFEEGEYLPLDTDPKMAWALRHPEFFPVEATTACYQELIRVPGIGPVSGKRILQARRYGVLSEEVLKKLGVVLKRARYFLTLQGKPLVKLSGSRKKALEMRQVSLFPEFTEVPHVGCGLRRDI